MRAGDPVGIVHIGAGRSATPDTCYATTMIMRPDELYLVSDAYMRTFPPEKGIPNVPRGQFQDDWQAGIREGTTECIIVQRMPADGESTMANYPYEARHPAALAERTDRPPNESGRRHHHRRQAGLCQRPRVLAQTGTDSVHGRRGHRPVRGPGEYHMDRACARYLTSETDAVVHLFNGEATFVNGEEQK